MNPLFEIGEMVEAYSGAPEDRVKIIQNRGDVVVIVADGAGGTGGGAAAAEAVIDHLSAVAADDRGLLKSGTWVDALARVDNLLTAGSIGQTTGVVAVMTATTVLGASVGDSEAWLVGPDSLTVLTQYQKRKPLLGDGAMPIPFEAPHHGATLLVATDGLTKYASTEQIVSCVRKIDLQSSLSALAESVRLKSGGLQDDVGIVLCRAGLS